MELSLRQPRLGRPPLSWCARNRKQRSAGEWQPSRGAGSEEGQRDFLGNTSHELHTPLKVIGARLPMRLRDPEAGGGSYRSTWQEVFAFSYQREDRIESLPTLTRSQSGIEERERFDLPDVAGEVLEVYESTATTSGLRDVAPLCAARVWGNSGLVGRLAFEPRRRAGCDDAPGGAVEVVVECRDDHAALRMTNTGSVVPPGDVEWLLEPFQRLAGGRDTDHNGLGLAIQADVANAQGAVLEVHVRLAGGLAVEVRFPAETR